MSMACKPPAPPKQTSWYITDHAVDRLRDRLSASAHLDNMALRSILGTAIDRVMETPDKVRRVLDGHGEEAEMILLDEDSLDGLTLRGAAYALIKPNDRPGSDRERAIVTILPAESSIARRMLGSGVDPEPRADRLRGPLIADPESLSSVVAEVERGLLQEPARITVEVLPKLLWPFPEDTAAVLVLRSDTGEQRVTCYPGNFDLLRDLLPDILRAVPDLGTDLDVQFFERRTLRLVAD